VTSKSSISFKGCLYTALWNAVYVHVLWPTTSVLSHKLKHYHYCLEHLSETSCKVWKCIGQQRSALVKHINVKSFSSLPLSLTYVFSLNRRRSIIWSMTACWMLDQPSFGCRLNSSTILLRFFNLFAKVWNVRKSQVGRYSWSPASHNKSARWLVCTCAGPLYF